MRISFPIDNTSNSGCSLISGEPLTWSDKNLIEFASEDSILFTYRSYRVRSAYAVGCTKHADNLPSELDLYNTDSKAKTKIYEA